MRVTRRSHLVGLVVSLGVASCGGGSVLLAGVDAGPDAPSCVPSTRICSTGTDTSHYAMGLEPLGDNAAPEPAAVEGDAHPEVLSYINGRYGQYQWVEARGYVHASLAATWQTLQNVDVAVDRRRINHWHYDPVPNSPYPFAVVVHNEVDMVAVVDFDITWGGDVGEGTAADPTLVSLRWDKTAGSSFITVIAGTCVARAVAPDVTEIEFVQKEQAIGQTPESITQFIQDFYASVVANVHGQPLPTYM